MCNGKYVIAKSCCIWNLLLKFETAAPKLMLKSLIDLAALIESTNGLEGYVALFVSTKFKLTKWIAGDKTQDFFKGILRLA